MSTDITALKAELRRDTLDGNFDGAILTREELSALLDHIEGLEGELQEKTRKGKIVADMAITHGANAQRLREALEAILPDAEANHAGGPDTAERLNRARAALAEQGEKV